jgi:hypothetical protein
MAIPRPVHKFLITGSVAAKHWFPHFRAPKDVDIISEYGVKSDKPSAFSVETHWDKAQQIVLERNGDSVFVDPSALYTIKLSHMQWDIKWSKTASDVLFFQKQGVALDPVLYSLLVPIWCEIHGHKKVNLNMGNEEFFTSYVERRIPHDTLHEMVAFGDRPLHEKIRPDLSSPMVDVGLWLNLTEQEKLLLFYEELLVIAIERFNLRKESKKSERLIALSGAYKKLVTTMTKGFFCDYMLLNYSRMHDDRQFLLTHLERILK